MFDGRLVLQVNLHVVDTIHPQSNKFAMPYGCEGQVHTLVKT